MTIAELFAELFEGREGSHAIKRIKDGNKYYVPARNKEGQDIALTSEVCEEHLAGKTSLGSYPIDQNNNVKWVAIDFDGKKGNSLGDAKVVKANLEKAGFICWLERSQSGKGTHLWIFFDKKVSAKKVRGVVSKYVPEFNTVIEKRTTSYDRMFPNQDSVFGLYGNLCGLPLNGPSLVKEGKTAFIKDSGEPYEQQQKLIKEIYDKRNKTELVEVLYVPIKTSKKNLPILDVIPGGTKLLAPQGCAWLRKAYEQGSTLGEEEWYAALGQFAKVENGDVLAHKFSEEYSDYTHDETQKKFDHAKQANKPMLCTTIWEKFGDCGKRCASLGVSQPWQLARVALAKLDEGNKGKIYSSVELADKAMVLAKEISEGKRMGFAWGYDLLDDFTELRPRNLVVVAARQGIGKTAVMIDASVLGAERGIPQYIFSIEMGHEELALRYLSRLSGVDHSVIVTGRVGKIEWEALNKADQYMRTLPIYIDDSTRDLDRMLDNAGELVYRNGVGPIWVDYLQLVRKKGQESQKEAVDRAVDGYKQMSKIVNAPVVTLAQLNRSEEYAEGDDDLDSWLKDSGNIEQTADVIHYLRGLRGPGTIERRWRLHKERHRPSGVNLKFEFSQGLFKFKSMGYWNKQAVMEDDDFSDDQNSLNNI